MHRNDGILLIDYDAVALRILVAMGHSSFVVYLASPSASIVINNGVNILIGKSTFGCALSRMLSVSKTVRSCTKALAMLMLITVARQPKYVRCRCRASIEPKSIKIPLQPNRIGTTPARRLCIEVPKPAAPQPRLFIVVLSQLSTAALMDRREAGMGRSPYARIHPLPPTAPHARLGGTARAATVGARGEAAGQPIAAEDNTESPDTATAVHVILSYRKSTTRILLRGRPSSRCRQWSRHAREGSVVITFSGLVGIKQLGPIGSLL